MNRLFILTDMAATMRSKYDPLIAEGLCPSRDGYLEDVGKAIAAIAKDYLPYRQARSSMWMEGST
jgi:hypothetical protein